MFKAWWNTLTRTQNHHKNGLALDHAQWLETMLALSLHGINHDIHMIWCIDREQCFEPFIENMILLRAPLCSALATFIISYAPADIPHILWIQNGTLHGVEPRCRALPHTASHTAHLEYLCTAHNGIIVESLPRMRSFTLMTKERIWSDTSSHHALALLKQLMV